jgi:hypothetical protein
MTAVWGPMGWMTLHSISICYPENPNDEDKKHVSEFMNAFAATITCVNCREHFSSLFSLYKTNVPSLFDSKHDLFLAICRMHNNVSKRLDKPILRSVDECIQSIKNASSYTSLVEFRVKYINYLFRDWNVWGRGTSYQSVAFNSASKMKQLNESYWDLLPISYDGILTDSDVINFPNQPTSTKPVLPKLNFGKFGFNFKFKIPQLS